MSNIIIHGAFQNKNFGDILLLDTLIDKLKLKKDNFKVSNCCGYVSKTIEVNRASFKDILKSKNVIFCGGGYLGERSKNAFRWHLQFMINHLPIMLMSILLKKNIIIFGVGFGPINNIINRYFIGRLFKKSVFCAVRDKESIDFINKYYGQINVKLTSDLVLAHDPDYYIKRYEINEDLCKSTIAIHLPGSDNNYHLRKEIIDFIKANNNFGLDLLFFSDNGLGKNQDYFDRSYKCKQYESMRQVLEVIKNSEIIITSKLHVGVIASIFKKKVVSVYAHKKTIRFYRHINREDVCLELHAGNTERIKDLILKTIKGDVSNISIEKSLIEINETHAQEINAKIL